MHLHFNKIGRGQGWERWLLVEDQHGDAAVAGEAILTYTDAGTYADLECDILFTRELKENEVDELLKEACSILSGRGNITIYTAQEVICKGFSLYDEDEEDTQG